MAGLRAALGIGLTAGWWVRSERTVLHLPRGGVARGNRTVGTLLPVLVSSQFPGVGRCR